MGDDQLETLRGRIPDLVFYPQADEHKLAAAQLIDQAGWRGVSRYGVKTWERQPLVLVNDGATQGAQFLKFASELQQDIRRQFSVALEMEPVVIGEEWPLS